MKCEFCDKCFKTKAEFIKHIRQERIEAMEIEYNIVDDIIRCDEILKKEAKGD